MGLTEFTVLAVSARPATEPFVQRACPQTARTSDDLYRLGYRVIGTDTVVAAIEIPAALLEEAISSNLTLSCRLTPDGNVIPESSFECGRSSRTRMWTDSLPLDQLVRATLTPQNLHLEEATIASLKTMLQRLEEAASLVKAALAQRTLWAKDHDMKS